MHPEIAYDLVRMRIEELHEEAARARLASSRPKDRDLGGSLGARRRLSLGRLRSKVA